MKKLRALSTRPKSIASPVGFSLIAILTAALWFSTSLAQQTDGTTCTGCFVCHKRSQTLCLTCNSLDYRRHLDHGDTMAPCSTSNPNNQ